MSAADLLASNTAPVCRDYKTGALIRFIPRLYGSPTILPGEAVSGWLYRVSRYHGLSLYALRRLVSAGHSFSYLDFGDRLTPTMAYDLASITLNSPAKILAAASPAMGVLTNKALSCLTFDLAAMVPIYRLCSECMAEDDIPYVRRTWRIAYTLVCDRHARGLIDSCRRCKQLFNFSGAQSQRFTYGDRLAAIRYCGHCGADQAKVPTNRLEEALWLRLKRFQYSLQQVVELGFLKHPRFGTISAALALESYLTTELIDKGGETIERFSAIDFHRCFGVHASQIFEALWPRKSRFHSGLCPSNRTIT